MAVTFWSFLSEHDVWHLTRKPCGYSRPTSRVRRPSRQMRAFPLFGIYGARGMRCKAPQKWILRACGPKATTQNHQNFVKRQTPQGLRAFFCGGCGVGNTGRLHVALKVFQGTSTRKMYYRTVRAIDEKMAC